MNIQFFGGRGSGGGKRAGGGGASAANAAKLAAAEKEAAETKRRERFRQAITETIPEGSGRVFLKSVYEIRDTGNYLVFYTYKYKGRIYRDRIVLR